MGTLLACVVLLNLHGGELRTLPDTVPLARAPAFEAEQGSDSAVRLGAEEASPTGARSAESTVRRPSIAARTLFYGAAGSVFGLAAYHSLVGRPEVERRFEGNESDPRWRQRLEAELLVASSQYYFSGFVTFTGASLVDSREPGKQSAGRRVLMVSMVPRIITALVIAIHTPDEWWKAGLNLVPVVMVTTGLLVW